MESNKTIPFSIQIIDKVKDVAIVMSFPSNANDYILTQFKSGSCEKALAVKHIDETAILYALYMVIKDNLCGTPMAFSRSRASLVECGIQSGTFIISFLAYGSLTYVRKAIVTALKCMAFKSLYAIYEKNMKSIGNKPDRSVYNKCANELASSISKKLTISAVGKANIYRKSGGVNIPPQKTLDELTKTFAIPKHSKLTPESTRSEVEKEPECDLPEINCSGIDALLLESYIRNVLHIYVTYKSKSIVVHHKSWDTYKKKLKEPKRIRNFIEKKYINPKLKTKFSDLSAYQAATSGHFNAETIKALSHGSFTEKNLETRINKYL